MKLAKLLSVALLGSFVMANVNAAPAAKQSAQKEDVALKNFNNAVGIRLGGFDKIQVQGKDTLVFVHAVTNKGNANTIKSLKWITALVLDNKAVLQIPANVNNLNLKPGQTTQANILVPVDALPKETLATITNPQNKFQQLIGAQELGYTNGKRIVIK